MKRNLYGFIEHAKTLRIKLKDGGYADFGKVMYPNQKRILQIIQANRKRQKRTRRFEIKLRQFAAASTGIGAAIKGDCHHNGGFDAVVTAHRKKSLLSLSQIYRTFYGRTKDKGKAARLSDELFEEPNGSRITVEMATDDLNRSGSVTHFHVSEADYIENFQEAWRSAEPSLSPAFWSVVFFETTLRKGVSGQFREVLEAAAAGKFDDWEVGFTAWWEMPHLALTLEPEKMADVMENLGDYERELFVAKEGRPACTPEQVAWYYDKRVNGMFGSLEAMQEAYPTSLEEALSVGFGGKFFRDDAIKFYEENIRPPVQRLKVNYDGITELLEGVDSLNQPHLEIWEPPRTGLKYRIGADCADADKRLTYDGSENYAVVIDEETGDVVAQWHGYCSAMEFAHILYKMQMFYNEAEIVPEVNHGGGAVIDNLRSVFHTPALYRREIFGRTIEVATDVYGFDTRHNTRQILVDRLQEGINRRLFSIPSKELLDQIKNFGRRGGAKVRRRGNAKVTPDDGCIALGLTTFGHYNLIEGYWRPKEAWVPTVYQEPKKKKRSSWGTVEGDKSARRVYRYDPHWNVIR